ncbi:MAG TPA: hypothetical protein PKN48_00825 [Bacteroidales bacterium]|nr:hypothetical protein [Bacteroidales bacterium]
MSQEQISAATRLLKKRYLSLLHKIDTTPESIDMGTAQDLVKKIKLHLEEAKSFKNQKV